MPVREWKNFCLLHIISGAVGELLMSGHLNMIDLCMYILCNFRHGAVHESCEEEVLKNTSGVN